MFWLFLNFVLAIEMLRRPQDEEFPEVKIVRSCRPDIVIYPNLPKNGAIYVRMGYRINAMHLLINTRRF